MGTVPLRPAARNPASGRPDFSEVFGEGLGYVWNALRRLGVASRDIEDVVQQVFLAVHAQLDNYDCERPLRPWLFGFALRAASNYRQLARHRLELVATSWEAVDPAPGAEEQLVTHEQRQLAEAALHKVELDRRAVLILHDVEGHSIPEIAQTLGLQLNTAYSRLRLARAEFQRAYLRLSAQRGAR